MGHGLRWEFNDGIFHARCVCGGWQFASREIKHCVDRYRAHMRYSARRVIVQALLSGEFSDDITKRAEDIVKMLDDAGYEIKEKEE